MIATVRDSGPLDVLVVNAGIALFGDALEQDPDAVDRLFRINIHAPYHAAVEAARQMPAGGRIIIIVRSMATVCRFPVWRLMR